jgi:arylformamidase
MSIYDITVPISPSMSRWPGDPEVEVSPEMTIAEHGYNLSRISMGTHTGTHVDAPRHVLGGGNTVDRIPLDLLIGKAYVFEVQPSDGWAIQPGDLTELGLPRDAKRLLLKTSNSDLWGTAPEFFEHSFVHLSKKAAHWLAGRGVNLLGIDYMSVDGFPDKDLPSHHELLEAGVAIVENLDLSRIQPGVYDLMVLPLKLLDGDGAPARAVLVR